MDITTNMDSKYIPLNEEALLRLELFKYKYLKDISLTYLKQCFEPIFKQRINKHMDIIHIIENKGFLAYNFLYSSLIVFPPWIDSKCTILRDKYCSFYKEACFLRLKQDMLYKFKWCSIDDIKLEINFENSYYCNIDECLANGYLKDKDLNTIHINDETFRFILIQPYECTFKFDKIQDLDIVIEFKISSGRRYCIGKYIIHKSALLFDCKYYEYHVYNYSKFVYSTKTNIITLLNTFLMEKWRSETTDCTYNPFI